MPDLTPEQQELFSQLYTAIRERQGITGILQEMSEDDFVSVFTSTESGKDKDGNPVDFSLLSESITRDNYKALGVILKTAAREKEILKRIVNGKIYKVYLDGENYTKKEYSLIDAIIVSGWVLSSILDCIDKGCGLEAFWEVISENNRKNIKAKLKNENEDRTEITAKNQEMLNKIHEIEKDMLFNQLGTAIRKGQNITGILQEMSENDINGLLKEMSEDEFLDIFKERKEDGFTLLGLTICNNNQKAMKKILTMAAGMKVLKEFEKDLNDLAKCITFTGSSSSFLNAVKESCGLEDFFGIINEGRRTGVIRRLNKDASGEAMKVGGGFGVIVGLIAFGGCFAAGVQLPILALIGIAAALVVGLAAYGITYAVLKPSNELEKINIEQNQETELQDMSNGKSCLSV